MSLVDIDMESAPNVFINRISELEWLTNYATLRVSKTIGISDVAGIGKTALLRQLLKRKVFRENSAVWLAGNGNEIDFDHLNYVIRTRRQAPSIVVLDDAEISEGVIEKVQDTVFNWKRIRTLFLIGRTPFQLRNTIDLKPLTDESSLALLEQLVERKVDIPRSLSDIAQGHPLAIHLIANLLRTHDPKSLTRLLQGPVYKLQNEILVPQRKLITLVRPKLILANEHLLERLKSRPEDIHQIDHRKFEELVAELLADMNFDVELTPATRDGGRDVLAYLNTPVGRLLCLVEAKKHRPDRPVGIALVRNLYGTLMDEQANSAMLVTTSDFSEDARKFERKHQWQLSLKNYTSLVEWIDNYKKPKSPPDSFGAPRSKRR